MSITLKAATRELGTSQVPAALRAFILGELADADWFSTELSEQDTEAARRHAASFLREAVNTYGSSTVTGVMSYLRYGVGSRAGAGRS